MDYSPIIDDFIYLGNAHISKNKEYLKQIGITHILNLAGKCYFPSDFIYKICHFKDAIDIDILEKLDSIFNFINDVKNIKGKLFIHCLGGISRSPTIVIAYLIKEHNLKLDDAYVYLKNIKPCIKPNIGFLQQLSTFENYVLNKK